MESVLILPLIISYLLVLPFERYLKDKRISSIMLHVTQINEIFMPSNTAKRVQKYRDSLRAAGLRPLQIWVPDTRKKGFSKECHRQSKLIQKDPEEREILKWISLVSDDKGWV